MKAALPRIYGIGLVYTLGGVLLLHWVGVYLDLYTPDSPLAHLTPLFDLDRERNIPTAISSLLFLLASYWCIRLVAISPYKPQKLGWYLLTGLFMYFAADEFFIIHEQLAEPMRKVLDISAASPLFHAWVVPGIVAVGFLAGVLIFVKQHKQKLLTLSPVLVRVLILGAGTITWEITGTYVYSHPAAYRFIMVPVEEMFELIMASIIGLQALRTYRTFSTKKQKILQQ